MTPAGAYPAMRTAVVVAYHLGATTLRTVNRGGYCCTLLLYASKMGNLAVRKTGLTWVELWGFEPQTSCMPWNGDPFTTVRDRSPATHLSWAFVQDRPFPFT
jgi:hypothetical protein